MLLLYALFFDNNGNENDGNLAHNHRFLLQMKLKAADKTLEHCFLKGFKPKTYYYNNYL